MKDIGHVIGGAMFTLKSVLLTAAGIVLGKLTGTTRRKVRERREKKRTQITPGQ